MKKLIIAFIFGLMSQLSFAQIDTSGLTQKQINQLVIHASNMQKNNGGNVSADIRHEAQAWGELGTNMGVAIVSAAKEIGVAADQFSQTSLGKIVTFVVVYKIIGQSILGVFFGTFILIVGYSFGIWLISTRRWSVLKYELVPVLFGLYTKKKAVSYREQYDGSWQILIGCVCIIMATIMSVVLIF